MYFNGNSFFITVLAMLVNLNYSIIHHYIHLIRTNKNTMDTSRCVVKYKRTLDDKNRKYVLKEMTRGCLWVLRYCGEFLRVFLWI